MHTLYRPHVQHHKCFHFIGKKVTANERESNEISTIFDDPQLPLNFPSPERLQNLHLLRMPDVVAPEVVTVHGQTNLLQPLIHVRLKQRVWSLAKRNGHGFETGPTETNFRGCTFGGVNVTCIYSRITEGDSGLC